MRSFTQKTLERKVRVEAEKQAEALRLQIAYEALVANAPEIARSAEAIALYALSLNGYGKERLQRVHGWICGLSEVGEAFGKQLTFNDVRKHMSERYGIDFNELTIRMPSWEEFNDET